MHPHPPSQEKIETELKIIDFDNLRGLDMKWLKVVNKHVDFYYLDGLGPKWIGLVPKWLKMEPKLEGCCALTGPGRLPGPKWPGRRFEVLF